MAVVNLMDSVKSSSLTASLKGKNKQENLPVKNTEGVFQSILQAKSTEALAPQDIAVITKTSGKTRSIKEDQPAKEIRASKETRSVKGEANELKKNKSREDRHEVKNLRKDKKVDSASSSQQVETTSREQKISERRGNNLTSAQSDSNSNSNSNSVNEEEVVEKTVLDSDPLVGEGSAAMFQYSNADTLLDAVKAENSEAVITVASLQAFINETEQKSQLTESAGEAANVIVPTFDTHESNGLEAMAPGQALTFEELQEALEREFPGAERTAAMGDLELKTNEAMGVSQKITKQTSSPTKLAPMTEGFFLNAYQELSEENQAEDGFRLEDGELMAQVSTVKTEEESAPILPQSRPLINDNEKSDFTRGANVDLLASVKMIKKDALDEEGKGIRKDSSLIQSGAQLENETLASLDADAPSSGEHATFISEMKIANAKANTNSNTILISKAMETQILPKFTSLIQQGDRHFSVQLSPAELGSVEIQIDILKSGKISILIQAEKASTLDSLKQDSAMLSQALSEAGYQTQDQNLEFSLSQQQEQTYNPFEAFQAVTELASGDNFTNLATGAESNRNPHDLVNITA